MGAGMSWCFCFSWKWRHQLKYFFKLLMFLHESIWPVLLSESMTLICEGEIHKSPGLIISMSRIKWSSWKYECVLLRAIPLKNGEGGRGALVFRSGNPPNENQYFSTLHGSFGIWNVENIDFYEGKSHFFSKKLPLLIPFFNGIALVMVMWGSMKEWHSGILDYVWPPDPTLENEKRLEKW